jgi:FKBP-type peptidyl-prolyl cis-trans isomerase FklB
VQTLPCGVQYKVLKEGNGVLPVDTNVVVVNYEGKLIDGTVFDASANHGDQPAEFAVPRVIKGWTEALKAMPVGSEWEIYIPENLAYGANGQGNIPPISTLIFKVELLEVK